LSESNLTDGSAASVPSSPVLAAVRDASVGDPHSTRLRAARIALGNAIQAVRDRQTAPTPEAQAMLARVAELYARANAAAERGDRYVAYDCLQQIECELVVAMSDEERWALGCLYAEEARAKLGAWRAAAAERLADRVLQSAPSVVALQALMRNVHMAAQNRRHKLQLIEAQTPVMIGLAVASVGLLAAWALFGGFDWLSVDSYTVTPGMWLVTGVLFGYFGGVVSMLFRQYGGRLKGSIPELRHAWLITAGRPVVGAAVAIPIVLLLQAGLLNVGEVTPALVLGACFVGGFSERWFVGRLEKLEGRGRS
jgi:hypothetical protein